MTRICQYCDLALLLTLQHFHLVRLALRLCCRRRRLPLRIRLRLRRRPHLLPLLLPLPLCHLLIVVTSRLLPALQTSFLAADLFRYSVHHHRQKPLLHANSITICISVDLAMRWTCATFEFCSVRRSIADTARGSLVLSLVPMIVTRSVAVLSSLCQIKRYVPVSRYAIRVKSIYRYNRSSLRSSPPR